MSDTNNFNTPRRIKALTYFFILFTPFILYLLLFRQQAEIRREEAISGRIENNILRFDNNHVSSRESIISVIIDGKTIPVQSSERYGDSIGLHLQRFPDKRKVVFFVVESKQIVNLIHH
jgi:hypothetical protein